MRLYAFKGIRKHGSVALGVDPHAIKIELSPEDLRRYEDTKGTKVARYELGPFVQVTDQGTGDCYEVATAPCGSPCHCAAVAVKLEPAGVAA